MNNFNIRRAVRNLVIITVLSLVYLFGKHLQTIHKTPGKNSLKSVCTNYK